MFDYQPALHSGAGLCKYTHDSGRGACYTASGILITSVLFVLFVCLSSWEAVIGIREVLSSN